MTLKTRIHDGIVGTMVFTGTWLGLNHGASWLYATGALACLMISSAFTKFCPVYYALDRIMSEDQSSSALDTAASDSGNPALVKRIST